MPSWSSNPSLPVPSWLVFLRALNPTRHTTFNLYGHVFYFTNETYIPDATFVHGRIPGS